MNDNQSNTQALMKGTGLAVFVHLCNLFTIHGVNVNAVEKVKLNGDTISFTSNGKNYRVTIIQRESEVQHG